MAHFEFVGKDHIKRGCHCQLEECSLDCSLRRKLVNKPTNADRIRKMSDEKLAEWVTTVGRTFGEEYKGYMSALDWLKRPAEGEQ